MDRGKFFIAKNLSVVSLGTLVSRILGFVRDAVIADRFGASPFADAFFVTFRIPNLFRRFLGEGALTASFIPVLSRHVEEGGDLGEVMDSAFSLLFLILTILVLLGISLAPYILKLIAPGFSEKGIRFLVGVGLLRVNFFYIFFISFVALCMGFLNTMGHFFAPAVGPALLNVAMIFSAIFLYKLFHPSIFALSFGVVLGGVLQLFFQVFFLKKVTGRLPRPRMKLFHPVVVESARLMPPVFLGMAASQINVFIGTILASFLPFGCVSYLYYADRLYQFPLGVFSIALGTVVLPLFSREADANWRSFRENLSFSLKFSLFLSIPAAVGLILFRIPIVSALFFRGRFTQEALQGTSLALLGYAIGIPAFSITKVLVPTFYSLKDTKTPFYISVLSLFTNTAFGIALLKPLRYFGLALSNSISIWISAVVLWYLMMKRVGAFGIRDITKELLASLLSSLPMAILAFASNSWDIWWKRGFFLRKFPLVLALILLSATFFFASSKLLSSPSFLEIERMVRGRFGKV